MQPSVHSGPPPCPALPCSHDLERLQESYPHLPCFASPGPLPLHSHVDIPALAAAALPPPRRAGRGSGRRARDAGLSALVHSVLGRRLDKGAQCSDWAARPLSPEQLAYASADAWCLLELLPALARQQAALLQASLPLPLSPAWLARVSGSGPQRPEPSESHLARHHRLRAARHAAREPGGAGAGTPGHRCNVSHLLQRYLGRSLGEGGKAAAVRAGAADTAGMEPLGAPRFQRGTGVVEWADAFFLFITLQPLRGASSRLAAVTRYDNRLLRQQGDDGAEQLCITWWPGRGRTAAHPVMQRMLGGPPVLLFLRQQDDAGYVFCGRLAPVGPPDTALGDCVTWRLLDWPALRASSAFLRLLALQHPTGSR